MFGDNTTKKVKEEKPKPDTKKAEEKRKEPKISKQVHHSKGT